MKKHNELMNVLINKLFYVVSDDSGVYITESPESSDEIHGVYNNADEATMALCREYSLRGE